MHCVIPLLLVVLPPPQGRIRIPPPKPNKAQQQQEKVEVNSVENFKRDLQKLKPLRRGQDNEDAHLRKMGEEYRDLDELILQASRQVDAGLMPALMKVARRYGTSTHGDELLFQLQVRPMGQATEDVVDTMVILLGDSAKDALFHCVRSRYAGLRRSAVARLVTRVGPEDLDLVLDLSRERKLDLIQAGVTLLGSIRTAESRERLMELLSQQPVTAVAASQALVTQGVSAVPDLQGLLLGPPLDRSYGYAAVSLVALEERTGREYLTDEMVPGLAQELQTPDPLQQTMVALALAEILFRSEGELEARFPIDDIVDALLAVVSPTGFVANLSSLQELSEKRLVRLTGQESPDRHGLWRSWWEEVRGGFVPMRRRVDVNADNAHLARITMVEGDWRYRIHGEGLGVSGGADRQMDIILGRAEILELVQQLERQGFMAAEIPQSIRSPLPNTRSLELLVGGARTRVAAPIGDIPQYDRLVDLVSRRVEDQKWQLYYASAEHADLRSFWETERSWLEQHPDPNERNSHLIDLILAAWPSFESDQNRNLALQHLLAVPGKQELLGEEQGSKLVEAALAENELGATQVSLLELALVSPGDTVWRQVLDVLEKNYATGGREALPRMFSLLGPDRVLECISDGRARIRLAALDEVVQLRDVRAVQPLIGMLRDPDLTIQRSAIFTLGMLRVREAERPLIEFALEDGTHPILRRECLVALGRVGGPDIAGFLQAALASPVPDDREAAVRGLGELRQAASSEILAEVFARHGETSLGTLARFSLQKHGALLSIPALQPHLRTNDPAVRRRVALLLGEFLDPTVIPELMAMLEEEGNQLGVVALLEGITGLDLAPRNDRLALLRNWYRLNRDMPQNVWFLDALRQAQIATTLTRDQLVPGAGAQAVPELARILVEARESRLRMLASAVLRQVTGEDYGTVSAQTPRETLEGIAVRYRFLADARKGGGPR